jgi:hypothetical protein
MNTVLEDRKNEIAEAMQALCKVVSVMKEVRCALESVAGHTEEERVLVAQMERSCVNLSNAAINVPQSFWAIMLAQEYDPMTALDKLQMVLEASPEEMEIRTLEGVTI